MLGVVEQLLGLGAMAELKSAVKQISVLLKTEMSSLRALLFPL